VVGFEGGLVAMRHGEPPGPPVGDTWYFNADRILLKIQKTDGLTLGKPARRYQTGGAHEGDFPLYLGKTWQYRDVATAEGKLTTFVHAYRVIGCENVKTPAGSFSAFKITYTQTNQRHRTWGERTLWYAPSVKYQIRAQTLTESRRGFWSAAVLNEELIEYRRPWMGDNTPRPELSHIILRTLAATLHPRTDAPFRGTRNIRESLRLKAIWRPVAWRPVGRSRWADDEATRLAPQPGSARPSVQAKSESPRGGSGPW
jgi:hypothetical protein